MRFIFLILALLLAACANQQVPPFPEPQYSWTKENLLVDYECQDGTKFEKVWFDLNAAYKDSKSGGILLSSNNLTSEYIKLTADNKFYRISGSLFSSNTSRVFQGSIEKAPLSIKGWLAFAKYISTDSEKHPIQDHFEYPDTGEKWKVWFIRVEVYDESLNQ